MSNSVPAILARLAPVRQRVVMRPLTVDEITDLERQVGLPIPIPVREYLGHIGLFQDLTMYGASEYEVFEHKEEFVQARQFLLKNFPQAANSLFPFADDGAGDVIGVKETSGEAFMFFVDHETGKIKELGTFRDWLSDVVDALLKQDRPPNGEKLWCVNFSFRVPDVKPILEVLRQFDTTTLGEWIDKGATPAGVHSFEAALVVGPDKLLLKRSEYHTWNQPMFSLDFEEPVALPMDQSRIRKLDAAFKAAGLGYKLVDYGPLDANQLDEERTSQATEKNSAPQPSTQRADSSKSNRSWWRFWR